MTSGPCPQLLASALLASVILLSSPGPAWADEAAEFSLSYSAPAQCPTRPGFLEQVRSRVPGANEAEGGPNFVVELREEGALVRGRLVVELEDGAAAERDVPAAPCADVARSLAIIVAIVLSGELIADPGPEKTVPAPAAGPAAPEQRSPTTPDNQPAHTPKSAPEPERPTAPDLSRLRFGAFAFGTLNFAAAPFPALGGGAGLELLFERGSILSPSLRAGAEYVVGGEQQGPGQANFALVAFLLRLCPVRYASASSWELYGCASFDAGSLTAKGDFAAGLETQMSWLSPGGALRVAAALSRTLYLELELAAFGLVHHDRFVFESEQGDSEIHDIPAFSGSVSIGIAGRSP